MRQNLTINGTNHAIFYDENALNSVLEFLGVTSENGKIYAAEAILLYSAGVRNMCAIYENISARHRKGRATIATQLRNSLNEAANNGKLARVNDLFFGEIYDYDYGVTNKQFVAIVSSYLSDNGKLFTLIINN